MYETRATRSRSSRQSNSEDESSGRETPKRRKLTGVVQKGDSMTQKGCIEGKKEGEKIDDKQDDDLSYSDEEQEPRQNERLDGQHKDCQDVKPRELKSDRQGVRREQMAIAADEAHPQGRLTKSGSRLPVRRDLELGALKNNKYTAWGSC